MGLKIEDVLQDLHTELAQKLLEKIQSGEATAADLSVARQFLKDNGIDSDKPEDPENPFTQLTNSLPFMDGTGPPQ